MKSSGICDLGYRAFRGSDRFTAPGAFRKREPVHLRCAITGEIGSPVTIRQPQVGFTLGERLQHAPGTGAQQIRD